MTTSHETLLIVDEIQSEERDSNNSHLGLRLDRFLSSHFVEQGKPLYSRTYFQKLIEEGLVKLNGDLVKKREQVYLGDEIEIAFPIQEELHVLPEEIPLDVIYEDDYLLAVNKPAGMVVHPAPGNPRGTFVNALLFYLGQTPTEDPLRPGIVHRLDKDTTGVLLAAKNPLVHRRLVEQFASRQIKKEYIAVCGGNLVSSTIDVPIGRDPKDRKKMWIDTPRAKQAITIVQNVSFKEPFSIVQCQLITGRTHQIRVHLAAKGHPILGDSLYGSQSLNQKYDQTTQLLHAHRIELTHPITNLPLSITAAYPDKLNNFLTNHFDQ